MRLLLLLLLLVKKLSFLKAFNLFKTFPLNFRDVSAGNYNYYTNKHKEISDLLEKEIKKYS
jgi:hypothetical protein